MPTNTPNTSRSSSFHKILVVDIETVPEHKSFGEAAESLQSLWEKKTAYFHLNPEEINSVATAYENRAGIYAEFGKIVCIGLGFINANEQKVRIKSLYNHDEKQLLQDFVGLVEKFIAKNRELRFCGHNIKEFDLPYICRRCIVHNIPLPAALQLSGLKPWQITHIDTLEMWRFGDYKHYTSLELLAQILNVPSSKTDIDGSDVANVYWKENNLERIAKYCMQDIFTTAMVYLRLLQINIDAFAPEYAE